MFYHECLFNVSREFLSCPTVRKIPDQKQYGNFDMDQGWGLLSQFSLFRYFPHFPLLSKQTLAIEYGVHIWQISLQLNCGDTCQIWMWFRESNRYFCKIENFAYGEISERSFSNPHPRENLMWGKVREFFIEYRLWSNIKVRKGKQLVPQVYPVLKSFQNTQSCEF